MARAKARHILVKDKEVCEKLKNDIKNAKDFNNAAKEFSECPSSQSGGSLGYFEDKQMVAEFDKVVFEAEIGKVYGPVKTQFGYHLILVEELEK